MCLVWGNGLSPVSIAFKVYWEHAGCLTLCFIPGSQNSSRSQDTLPDGLPYHFFFLLFLLACVPLCIIESHRKDYHVSICFVPIGQTFRHFRIETCFWSLGTKRGFVAKRKVYPTGFQSSLLICLKSTDKLLHCRPCWWAQGWRGFSGACPSQVAKCTHRSQC